MPASSERLALACTLLGLAACAMPRSEKSVEDAKPTAADAPADAVVTETEAQFAPPPPEPEPVESADRLARADPLGELDRLERQLMQVGVPVGRYRDASRGLSTATTGESVGSGKAASNKAGGASQSRPATPAPTAKPSKDAEFGAGQPKREDKKKPKSKKKGKKQDANEKLADGDDDFKEETEKEGNGAGYGRAPGGLVVGGGVEMDVGARCEAVCELAEAICELESQICELSSEHPEDERYAEACERAGDDCREASRECTACAG